MRAVGHPDAFLPTDLGVRRALAALGEPADPRSIARLSERWRPWRAYAVMHLWRHDVERAAAEPATRPAAVA
jgi:AraC family transcriptional regulator of adaptative response / DNA-3-methyladenine glycosylase II